MKDLKQIMDRGLALFISSVMCLSLIPVAAFATEESSIEVPAKPGGETESIDVTITTDEEGRIITSTGADGVLTESGLKVAYQGTESAEGSSNGFRAESTDGTYQATGGSETTVETVNGPDIAVDVYNKDSGSVGSISISGENAGTETSGNLQEDDPANYDQTTETTTDRTVEVEVNNITITSGSPVYTDENGNVVDLNDGYFYFWDNVYTIDNDPYEKGDPSCGRSWYYIVDADGNPSALTHPEGTFQRSVRSDNGTPDDPTDDVIITGLYCADKSTGVQPDLMYRKVNLEDAAAEGYYTVEEAAHLRAILKNGWDWSDGADSTENLDAIKAMMRASGQFEESDIENLTRNQAAVATGMAIWQYGNRIELNEGETLKFTSQDELTDALYEYLITLTDDTKETQIINEEKFVDDLSVVIGSMVREDEKDQANNDNPNNNDVYNVSLRFSLVVTPGDGDDLIVKVLDKSGAVIKEARIAGELGENEEFAATDTDENGKTYYVLDGLKLAENSDATFNLKLEGIQRLEEGVYIFESEQLPPEVAVQYGIATRSQNFIGKFGGTAEIDAGMQIDMTFNVEESTVTTEHIWRTEQSNSNNDRPFDPVDPAEPVSPPSAPEVNIPDPDMPNVGIEINAPDVPLADMPNEEIEIDAPDVPLADLFGEDVEINDPDVPLANMPDEEIEINDPDVPLADVPQTGEASSTPWLVAILLGSAGLVFVNTGKRKEDAR